MSFNLDKKIYYLNIFLLLIISSLLIYLLYTNLKQQREAIFNDAKVQTETLSRFISTDIDRIIFGVEELIEGINNAESHVENDHHDKEMAQLLVKNMRPYIMDILIVNKEAQIVHWTHEHKKPDISHREYIQVHLHQKHSPVTYVGKPKLSKVHPNQWFFAISKAFYEKNELKQIIVMILDLSFFQKRYQKNLINQNDSIFIASSSGQLYTRFPSNKNYTGVYLKEIDEFAKLRIEKQHYDIPSPLDNQTRIATLVHSPNYPIVVGTTLRTKDILEDWVIQKNRTILIATIITIGFLILILYYTKLQKKLIMLSQRDCLTKLYNRGYFTSEANKLFSRSQRLNESMSIIMIDIDDFKRINDTYGHKKGDEVIQLVASIIDNSIRDIDLSCRYGGEEFIILLVQSNHEDAKQVSERIKKSLEKAKGNSLTSTLSFGITQKRQEDKDLEAIIHRADIALYTSKAEGKNRITTKII